MEDGSLMTEADAGLLLPEAGPGAYGLKVRDDEIIILYLETMDLVSKAKQIAVSGRLQQINATIFSEHESKSLKAVFRLAVAGQFYLPATDQYIDRPVFPESRQNASRTRDVSVTSTLNGI